MCDGSHMWWICIGKCVCVCICVSFMHLFACVLNMNICMYLSIPVCTYVHMYKHVHALFLYAVYVCMYKHMHLCSGMNVNTRACICEQTLPMQMSSSCSGSPASQHNGSSLPFLLTRVAFGLRKHLLWGTHHASAHPGHRAAQLQRSPGFAQLLPSPTLFPPFWRELSLIISHASRWIPSQAQLQVAWPKAALLYTVGTCAYANVHAHTVVFLCAPTQETWEELGERESWRKSTDFYLFIFLLGKVKCLRHRMWETCFKSGKLKDALDINVFFIKSEKERCSTLYQPIICDFWITF